MTEPIYNYTRGKGWQPGPEGIILEMGCGTVVRIESRPPETGEWFRYTRHNGEWFKDGKPTENWLRIIRSDELRNCCKNTPESEWLINTERNVYLTVVPLS